MGFSRGKQVLLHGVIEILNSKLHVACTLCTC